MGHPVAADGAAGPVAPVAAVDSAGPEVVVDLAEGAAAEAVVEPQAAVSDPMAAGQPAGPDRDRCITSAKSSPSNSHRIF